MTYERHILLEGPTFVNTMGRYYCLSILDKHHHPDIDFDQGLKILRMCTDELQRRLPIDFKGVSELTLIAVRSPKLTSLRVDVGQSDR